MNPKQARMEKLLDRLVRTELEQFVHYLASPWRIMWANFLAGTARGLGFILGVGLLLTVVGFLLTKVLSQIPLVGDFFSALNVWIQETINKS